MELEYAARAPLGRIPGRRPPPSWKAAAMAERFRASSWLLVLGLAALGCQNPYALRFQGLQRQQASLQQYAQQLQNRIDQLNQENERLHQQVAQLQRESQLLQEQADALAQQLRSATDQAARLRAENERYRKRAESLQASLKRRGGAIITPNNSLENQVPAIDEPGVKVLRDGDLVRVILPGRALFSAGSDRLRPDALGMLARVGETLARTYPNQRIGVEGHLGRPEGNQDPVGQHRRSLQEATAVMDYLVRHTSLSARQLFVVGHGSSRPRFSNATPQGRQANHRIELVVYPDLVEPQAGSN